MPPFVARKRQRSASPPASTPPKKKKKSAVSTKKPRKNVFETLDAQPQPVTKREETEAFLNSINDPESSLSDVDSDEFEDALPESSSNRRKVGDGSGEESDESEDEMDWENAMPAPRATSPIHKPTGDLEITLEIPDDAVYSRGAGDKKGPTKRERVIRVQTHCMHVQFLLWHNSIRNSWINDKEVQASLVNGLSDGIKAEVSKWRTAMGHADDDAKHKPEISNGKANNGKSKAKGKGKAKETPTRGRERIRDWGGEAAKQEEGTPNLSRGDPLIRLLKYLSAYWKKRFRITAPGLRKLGYRSIKDVREEVESFQNDPYDPAIHGERIASVEEFRTVAKKWEGSRDVSAQLFTALLRALGIEARLVASLQPSGFGWSKSEEGKPRKPSRKTDAGDSENAQSKDNGNSEAEEILKASSKASNSRKGTKAPAKTIRKSNVSIAIDLDDDSSSDLSSVPESNFDLLAIKTSPAKTSSSKPFDKDPPYPIYWTEALSPVTNTYFPVSTQVNPNIATSLEHYAGFEPRGAAADKAKQVLCYVVAYSKDGSAKDVTVRYLKRHQLPGKTKGFRLPVEKMPIYNKRGKVLKYEDYDWFKRVMSGYERPTKKRIAADDIEEQGDLVPFKPASSAKDGTGDKGVETLQGYKNSAEFVLERHLRREEAIVPNAKPVKTFRAGKGDKAVEELVFRREDVVACKTVESWHKEGRELKIGEQPLKHVPYRAVTLVRIRELEDTHRETGEKPTQGLYSKAQTDWIIPDPIQDGHIPKNGFGNIDVYVPSMIPQGATHVRLKGTAKLCRKLGIEYAEACTGFEFGNRRAVPVLTGVVVAEENRHMVIDAWREEERIKKEKEDGKREQRSLVLWKKFLHGLRVVKRMKETYGVGDDLPDDANPFMRKKTHADKEEIEEAPTNTNGDTGGGFLLDNADVTEDVGGGGFLLPGESDESDVEGGGFIVEGEAERSASKSAITETGTRYFNGPISMRSLHKKASPEMEDDSTPGEDRKMAEESPLSWPDEGLQDESDEAPVKSKRSAPCSRATRGRKARGGSNARPKRGVLIDKEEEGAESHEQQHPISSPDEASGDEFEDFAPSKLKHGNLRTRANRSGKARGSSNGRPSRGATTSSPYFKKLR
jgi:xeroderma pigmentosum group C-complementing protein